MHHHSRPSTLHHSSRPTPITSITPPPILIYTSHPQCDILSPRPTTSPTTHTRIRSEGILRTKIGAFCPILGLKLNSIYCPLQRLKMGICPFLGPFWGAHPTLCAPGICPSTVYSLPHDTRIGNLGLSTFLGCRRHGGTLTKYPRQVESPRPPIRLYLLLW